jgi:hypothetical protein
VGGGEEFKGRLGTMTLWIFYGFLPKVLGGVKG